MQWNQTGPGQSPLKPGCLWVTLPHPVSLQGVMIPLVLLCTRTEIKGLPFSAWIKLDLQPSMWPSLSLRSVNNDPEPSLALRTWDSLSWGAEKDQDPAHILICCPDAYAWDRETSATPFVFGFGSADTTLQESEDHASPFTCGFLLPTVLCHSLFCHQPRTALHNLTPPTNSAWGT